MCLLPNAGYSEGSRRFDPAGHATPAPGFSKAEASGFLEYGITDSFALVAAPTLSHQRDGPATNSVSGSDSSAFGARVALWQVPGWVVAVQALMQPPVAAESDAAQLQDGGARAFATDVRLMLGHGFTVYGLPAFFDIDPGVRVRAAPFPDEARLDATIGVRPWPRLLFMLQDFSSFAPPRGIVARQSSSKLQMSVVYDLSRTWSVQAGGFHTIVGRDVIRETGPFGALWYRF